LEIETVDGCFDSSQQSVSIGAGLTCQAEFSATPTAPFTYQFASSSTTSGPGIAAYVWRFGDGNSDSTSTPNALHTYSTAGTYSASLIIYSGGCSDTAFQTITVIGGPCQADFTWMSNGGNSYQFTNLSNVDTTTAAVSWSFGDGSSSTQISPAHTYAGPGPWPVCLTVTDSVNGCFLQVCDTVGGGPSNGYNLSGAVMADSTMPIFDGTVYLIAYDSVAATLTALDSTAITGSFYHFPNLPPGDYLVKAALRPTSPFYADYLPTYLGDAFFWNDAIGTILTNSNVINPPINLIAGTNPGGPGFIGGLVSAGANKTTGDPLSDVSVLLFTSEEEPVAHVKTNVEGEFSFDNLPYGTYHLYVDMLNRYSERHVITLSAAQPRAEAVTFEATEGNVFATDVAAEGLASGVKAYPNPTKGTLQVVLTLTQPTPVRVRLVNLMGQTVMTRALGQQSGEVAATLTLSDLPAGMYTLEVQAGAQRTAQRIRLQP
jgi:hypothetical protein